MTKAQFEREIRRLVRRLSLLRAAASGEVKLRRVKVAACWVERHQRGEHYRYVGPRRHVSRTP